MEADGEKENSERGSNPPSRMRFESRRHFEPAVESVRPVRIGQVGVHGGQKSLSFLSGFGVESFRKCEPLFERTRNMRIAPTQRPALLRVGGDQLFEARVLA